MPHLRGIVGLFRMHPQPIVDCRPHRKMHKKGQKGKPRSKFIKRLDQHDPIVEWRKPGRKPKWMNREQYAFLPQTFLVRALRDSLARKGQRTLGVTIAMTLLDPVLYPKSAIAARHKTRWLAETHFAELKTTLRMRQVKSPTVEGVRKELAIDGMVYNLVHVMRVEATARQQTTPDRISFIDAVQWLLSVEPGETLAERILHPPRPDRHEPRVVKHRRDSSQLMTRPRSELRKEWKPQTIDNSVNAIRSRGPVLTQPQPAPWVAVGLRAAGEDVVVGFRGRGEWPSSPVSARSATVASAKASCHHHVLASPAHGPPPRASA